MTTRKLALLTIGIVTLATFSAPALADGWGFGFSYRGGHGWGHGYGGGVAFGWGGGYDRPCYFPRTYVYRSYSPVVVYRDYSPNVVVYGDCAPDVVTYDQAPVTVFRSYCAPAAVVYPAYAPRYYGGVYVARSYYPAYRGFRGGFYYNSGHHSRPVPYGGHHRAYWR